MKQLREFSVDAAFANGARLAWRLEAASAALAYARAWTVLAHLLEDATVEAVVGTNPEVVRIHVQHVPELLQ
jgi:hypothetical protein